jgi:hypothetical protein
MECRIVVNPALCLIIALRIPVALSVDRQVSGRQNKLAPDGAKASPYFEEDLFPSADLSYFAKPNTIIIQTIFR